ncbi:hypothetical protein AAW01_05940 [Aurantiacibacter gangjinensis]|uniref:Uncharacterized protein n=1 Tax=Aurantiacibacter gangjinensis TaxID=502682 RepID=A0A0G9MSN6_9SPHN|nr:hypothetical protein AAW01_05940 [Aurantiacibacter gangjinensis]
MAGTRAERFQRLQVGLLGIAAMVLLVGLADAISSRAQLTQEAAVPEAAPTTEPSDVATPRDPLAEAGVAPELPAEPTPSPTAATPNAEDDVPPPVSNAQLQ